MVALEGRLPSAFGEMRGRQFDLLRWLTLVEDGVALDGDELGETANHYYFYYAESILICTPSTLLIHLYLILSLNSISKPSAAQYQQSQQMQGLVDQLATVLHLDSLDESKELEFVEKKTGIKPSGFVMATLVFLIIVTLISSATTLVVGIGCVVAPAYFTFLVLETNNKKAVKRYLIYWMIYAIMELVSPLLILLLPSAIYIVIRIAIAVLLLHPESPAAEKVYERVLEPLLTRYETDIDKNIDEAMRQGRQGLKKGGDYLQRMMNK